MPTLRGCAPVIPPSNIRRRAPSPATSAIIESQVKVGYSRPSATRHKTGGILFVGPENTKGAPVYGPRNGEVVQRREGLRLYLPGRRGRGPLRAPHGYSRQRLQVPRGRPEGHLRGDPGQEGDAG